MITEEEARKQNLPGSDVFLRTQLAYKTELNRDALIVYLNREAYKAFVDTITIGQYPQLKEETERTIRNLRLHPPTVFRRIEYMDLENFKIAAGFELHLKACLLSNDIVIHVIANTPPFVDLRRKQRKEPAYKDELLAIEGFYYNGQLNILRGLTSQSLNFDTILNTSTYRHKLGKPQDFLDIVEDYRNLRNQIHLPGDFVEAPHINTYAGDSLMRMLVQFINEEIVDYNNKLIDKWKLNTASKLPPLTYF
jgi:hypothetical protein